MTSMICGRHQINSFLLLVLAGEAVVVVVGRAVAVVERIERNGRRVGSMDLPSIFWGAYGQFIGCWMVILSVSVW